MPRSTLTLALALLVWLLHLCHAAASTGEVAADGGIGDRPGKREEVVITIVSPPSGTRTLSAAVLLLGTVRAGQEDIREVAVAVNGRPLPADPDRLRLTPRGAVLAFPVPLDPGENMLTVTSIDRIGVPSQKAVAVFRSTPPPPVPPPSPTTASEPPQQVGDDHRDRLHREMDSFINRWGDDHGEAILAPGCRR